MRRKASLMSATTLGARSSVAAARVQIPRPPLQAIRRLRLTDDELGRRPVTLVSAAAGSGKTLLVTTWARSATERGDHVAWLTIESTDDKPYEFWSAVLEAFQVACPPEVAQSLGSLSPPRDGFEPGFTAATLDLLDDTGSPTWLVIDDAHRLQHPEVVAAVDYFLTHLPAGLRVVLVSRREPAFALHKLRLNDELQTIDGSSLAFTRSEATELFAGLDIRLPDDDIDRLVARTEGWAAGLRLAAVALSQSADPHAFVANFAGADRAVEDYLFGEIIQHVSPDLYRFMLDTCAPEQLPIALAAELSGRSDAGELLDGLYRSNVLVVQAGDSSGYRYHSLLRQFLQHSLQRRDVGGPVRQHAATARWMERHGQPATALSHALASTDDALLSELIRRHGLRLILSGQASRILNIIDAAPGIADRSDVATIAAVAALEAGDLPRADHWLAITRHLPAPATAAEVALQASAEVHRAVLGGDVAEVLARTSILTMDGTGDDDADLMLLTYRAPGRMRSGDYPGAVADLQRALSLARAGRYNEFELTSLSGLSGMAGAMCDLQESRRWAEEAIAFAAPRGWAASRRLSYAYLLAGWTAFETGDTEGQRHHAALGMRSLDEVNNVEVELGVRSMHALAVFEASAGHERWQAARHFHQLWSDPTADQASPALTGNAEIQEVRLALSVGEIGWATTAVHNVRRRLPDSAEAAIVNAELALAHGRVGRALELLAPAADNSLASHLPTSAVIANVITAHLEHARGNVTRAVAALEKALEWAAPQDYQRPFIDAWPQLKPLLATRAGQFGHANEFVDRLMSRADLREPENESQVLSPKQLELLRDLQAVLPVRELAAIRGVSVNTARSHLRAIYRKLGASSRAEALQIAREKGLI